MPKPKPGESRNDFVGRCVPMLMDEGKTQDQAVGACEGMYTNYRKSLETMDALKFMKLMEMGARDYATSQAWDIRKASEVLAYVADLAVSEIGEPTDLSKLTNMMREILQFVESEIQELELSSRDIAGKNAPAEPAKDTETVPAEVKAVDLESLDLSYMKSLGFVKEPDFLAVKFVAKDEIKGYSHLWGNENLTDIEIEFFTPLTDFWDDRFDTKTRPLTWDHAQDPTFKADPVVGNIVDFGDDDIGRWYVAKLERSHEYNKAIAELIKQGLLGTSSDSAPQYVERVKTGKATWLKTWPFFAAALTDTPCEPRMIGSLEFLKSLGITLPETPEIDVEGEIAIIDYYKIKYQTGD